jgi:hypothetical protein
MSRKGSRRSFYSGHLAIDKILDRWWEFCSCFPDYCHSVILAVNIFKNCITKQSPGWHAGTPFYLLNPWSDTFFRAPVSGLSHHSFLYLRIYNSEELVDGAVRKIIERPKARLQLRILSIPADDECPHHSVQFMYCLQIFLIARRQFSHSRQRSSSYESFSFQAWSALPKVALIDSWPVLPQSYIPSDISIIDTI